MPIEKKIAIRDGPDRDAWLYNELKREGYKVSSRYFIKNDKVSALKGLADAHRENCDLDEIASKHEEECYFDNSNKNTYSKTARSGGFEKDYLQKFTATSSNSIKSLTREYPTIPGKKKTDFWSKFDDWNVQVNTGKGLRKATRQEKIIVSIVLSLIAVPFILIILSTMGIFLIPMAIFAFISHASKNSN